MALCPFMKGESLLKFELKTVFVYFSILQVYQVIRHGEEVKSNFMMLMWMMLMYMVCVILVQLILSLKLFIVPTTAVVFMRKI